MAIGDDWSIDYTNKRVYRSANNNVYDVNDLYSWLMDTFDELNQMDDPVPMSAQTPTEYTMINGWFIDGESIKYLKNGAIKTSGYDGEIQVLELLESGYTNCVPTDIGEMVQDDVVDAGPLLAYDNTLRKWWIRATGTIVDGSAMTIPTGTGAGTADGASVTGEDLYANVYTLGTITDNPSAQIYIFQAGEAIAEWSDKTNWDRGHIDVLIKVKEAGTEIDDGVITVFTRQYGDMYDNYEIDLTAGGRNAVPVATATDLDNATGDYYLLYDAETAAPAVGDVIVGETSKAEAEVVAIDDWGTEGLLTLGSVKGTFQDNENLQVGGSTKVVTNGTVGDTYVTYDAEGGTPPGVSTTMLGGTSGAKRILRGIQDDGTTGKLVLQVDTTQTGTSRDAYYKAFEDNEEIQESGTPANYYFSDAASMTVVSGFSDITIAFVNGVATHGGTTGTFIEGERVTWPTGQSGILLKDTGSAITLGNCTDTALNTKLVTGDISGATCTCSQDLQSAHTMEKAFEAATAKNYDIIVECGNIYEAGRSVANVYEYFKFVTKEDSVFKMYTVVGTTITLLDGEEYIIAYTGYTPKKASPLATFAGGVLFGAQGLWIEGMATEDVRNYTLIDSDGVKQDPPNKQAITVTGLGQVDSVWDKVSVFRTSAGEIDKAMYSSHATNNTSGTTSFEVQEDITVDTPATGFIRIVDVDAQSEERLAYTSWTGKIFTLSVAHKGGYDGSDKAYVPFIDEQASAATLSKTVIYIADRTVLTRVRNKGILPFEIAGTYGATGIIVAAIRTVDAIVT